MSNPVIAMNLPRPFRAVTLPGGGAAHVRELTIADLYRIDQLIGASMIEAGEHEINTALLMAAAALCDKDGATLYPDALKDLQEAIAAVESVKGLTPSQVRSACEAATGPPKDDAKN